MNRGPNDREVEEWLRIARQDWHRSRVLLADGDGAGAGFYLQQSLEKYLKGFLISRGWELKKIHTLHALLDEATRHLPGLGRFRGLCERISGYYVLERYPFTGEGPDIRQVHADMQESRSVVAVFFASEKLE